MKRIRRSAQITLGVLALLMPNTGAAQAVSLVNTNFGLIAGETQYLFVDQPGELLVDQFFFDLTRPIDYLTATLKSNVAYRVRISGRGGIGPLDRGSAMPDAAFAYVNWQDLDVVRVPGDGFGVTAWDGVWGRRPANDVYTTTHVYDYFVEGRGAGLSFRYRDNPYSDNVGGYSVSLYEVGGIAAVPEPTTAPLMLVGLLGLVGVVARVRANGKR